MTTLVVITNSWDELMCSGKISDCCCTSRIRPAKKTQTSSDMDIALNTNKRNTYKYM